MIRRYARQFLYRLGYEVSPVRPRGWGPLYGHINGTLARFEPPRWQPDYLCRFGHELHTLVDVGVGVGTPALYQAFPHAHLVLVEPLREFWPQMERLLQDRDGVHLPLALADAPGQRTIQVVSDHATRSSMYERTALEREALPPTPRVVPVSTLDALLHELALEPPFGLKLDTEGAELDILRGGHRFLEQTEFVIAELPLAPRFVEGYSTHEVIGLLADAGFHLRDVLDIGRAGGQTAGVATFFDGVFVRDSDS